MAFFSLHQLIKLVLFIEFTITFKDLIKENNSCLRYYKIGCDMDISVSPDPLPVLRSLIASTHNTHTRICIQTGEIKSYIYICMYVNILLDT